MDYKAFEKTNCLEGAEESYRQIYRLLWSGYHIGPPNLLVCYKPYTWRCENKIISNNNFVKPFQKFK